MSCFLWIGLFRVNFYNYVIIRSHLLGLRTEKNISSFVPSAMLFNWSLWLLRSYKTKNTSLSSKPILLCVCQFGSCKYLNVIALDCKYNMNHKHTFQAKHGNAQTTDVEVEEIDRHCLQCICSVSRVILLNCECFADVCETVNCSNILTGLWVCESEPLIWHTGEKGD